MTKPPPLSLALGDAHRMGSWGDTGATKTQATLSPGPETRVRSLAYSHFGADGLLHCSSLSPFSPDFAPQYDNNHRWDSLKAHQVKQEILTRATGSSQVHVRSINMSQFTNISIPSVLMNLSCLGHPPIHQAHFISGTHARAISSSGASGPQTDRVSINLE